MHMCWLRPVTSEEEAAVRSNAKDGGHGDNSSGLAVVFFGITGARTQLVFARSENVTANLKAAYDAALASLGGGKGGGGRLHGVSGGGYRSIGRRVARGPTRVVELAFPLAQGAMRPEV